MHRLLKTSVICAAALSILHGSATYARDIDVKVSTLSTYESQFMGCEARIVTPVFTGLAVDKAQDEINADLAKRARSLAARYEAEALLAAKAGDGGPHFGYLFDYRVLADDEKYLAVEVTELNIAGSSSTTRKIYNFDKQKGLPFGLSDLFNEKANYIKTISDYIKSEMRRRNAKGEGPFWIAPKDKNGFSSIKPGQDFYLNGNGDIVVCFDKYEVAPGSSGTPEFIIPRKIIGPYLKK